jgi:precorrin-6x reductase
MASKSVSYKVAKLATNELIKLNKHEVIQQILDKSGNNLFLTLGTLQILKLKNCVIHSENFSRILKLLSYDKVKLDIGITPILCF